MRAHILEGGLPTNAHQYPDAQLQDSIAHVNSPSQFNQSCQSLT